MIEITTTTAERERLREGMGPMFTLMDNAVRELHALYMEFFEHSEIEKQKPIKAYDAEYLGRRLFSIEAVLADTVREWQSLAGITGHQGEEYEIRRAKRLLEITEAEKLARDVFLKYERTGKEQLMQELIKAKDLPDAEAIPILRGLLE